MRRGNRDAFRGRQCRGGEDGERAGLSPVRVGEADRLAGLLPDDSAVGAGGQVAGTVSAGVGELVVGTEAGDEDDPEFARSGVGVRVGAAAEDATGQGTAVYTGCVGVAVAETGGVAVAGADGVAVTRAGCVAVARGDCVAAAGAGGVALAEAAGVAVARAGGVAVAETGGVALAGADGAAVARGDCVAVARGDCVAVAGAGGAALTGAGGVVVARAGCVVVAEADGVAVTRGDCVAVAETGGVALAEADGAAVARAGCVAVAGANGVAAGADVFAADGRTFAGLCRPLAAEEGSAPGGHAPAVAGCVAVAGVLAVPDGLCGALRDGDGVPLPATSVCDPLLAVPSVLRCGPLPPLNAAVPAWTMTLRTGWTPSKTPAMTATDARTAASRSDPVPRTGNLHRSSRGHQASARRGGQAGRAQCPRQVQFLTRSTTPRRTLASQGRG